MMAEINRAGLYKNLVILKKQIAETRVWKN